MFYIVFLLPTQHFSKTDHRPPITDYRFMSITAIIFSKDRTLQLKSLLMSLRDHADLPEGCISIIYKNTISDISYEPVMAEFPGCRFVSQRDFLADLTSVVANTESEYIQFMVDDLIFRDTFSYAAVEKLLGFRSDIDSFCPRMGMNIQCFPAPLFESVASVDSVQLERFLVWDTASCLGKHWNYCFDVSSSIYRKSLVQAYLGKCRPGKESFPNPFEDHFYTCMPTTHPRPFPVNLINSIRFLGRKKTMRIACHVQSKCFTQGVNLVADIDDPSRAVDVCDPVSMHNKMLEGYVIDFRSLKNALPDQPNAGHKFFKLAKLA